MSVYTELTFEHISSILADYQLGTLENYTGIAAGIENSNFFIHTNTQKNTPQSFVLTIFERLAADELPYFMRLMKHLAKQGLQCPDVMVRNNGALLFDFATDDGVKQGCIVSCLSGETLDTLNLAQLRSSGEMLAKTHLAGASFAERRSNPTGFSWLAETISQVRDAVAATYGQAALNVLDHELTFQQQQRFEHLPHGLIHGDLFCDNILFSADDVSGVIDFYYAHDAPYVMDIAIALNAQAVLLGDEDTARQQAFLSGYSSVRPLQQSEEDALPICLRLAALRFWVSRLFDAFYPRAGAMTQTKDPEEYRLKLCLQQANT